MTATLLLSVACGSGTTDDGSGATAGIGGDVAERGGTSGGGGGGTGGVTGGSGGTGGVTGDSGGTGDCAEDCTAGGFVCCDGRCVNLGNDFNNCGACGTQCSGDTSFCNLGTCVAPQCDPACENGQVCCLQMLGPWVIGCTDLEDGTCPRGSPTSVCASPDTPIATPDGERPIAELQVGDLVYSNDEHGVVVVPVIEVNQVAVDKHHVLRVSLASGRALEVSAAHPTTDGRTFGDLQPGSALDGVAVVSSELVPYTHAYTYEILPGSPTGAYYAAGVAIGSTLRLSSATDR